MAVRVGLGPPCGAPRLVEVVVRSKRAVIILDEGGTRSGADMIQDGGTWKAE